MISEPRQRLPPWRQAWLHWLYKQSKALCLSGRGTDWEGWDKLLFFTPLHELLLGESMTPIGRHYTSESEIALLFITSRR